MAVDERKIELPLTGITLEEARRQLTALHFSKEALSSNELQVLYLGEGLLRLVEDLLLLAEP